jgi:aryl-alcohol dehydrogenase-like predicted oxidoreductase
MEGIDRSKIQLMVKIGMNTRSGQFQAEGSPEQLRSAAEYALKELGTDYIDIVVLCRVDPKVPIEESTRGLKALVDAGIARAIGLSEASAENIRKAHNVHPIACIEQEYSVWTRDIEDDIIPTCRELGIVIVAYSPLGRGFLAGALKNTDSLGADDFRKHGQPRLTGDALATNNALLAALEAVAARKGCSVGQLSLAWVHAQGPDVFPIPGTTTSAHLKENLAAAAISLTPEDLKEIEAAFPKDKVRACARRPACACACACALCAHMCMYSCVHVIMRVVRACVHARM